MFFQRHYPQRLQLGLRWLPAVQDEPDRRRQAEQEPSAASATRCRPPAQIVHFALGGRRRRHGPGATARQAGRGLPEAIVRNFPLLLHDRDHLECIYASAHNIHVHGIVLLTTRGRFFSNVQPYIPIIGAAYFGSIEPTQLLLSAMYGVAARLPGAIVSTRDFLHIKRVFEHQLKNQMTRYKPSLQACQALTLIHLTLEMQCEGLEGVETWPLRLSAVRDLSWFFLGGGGVEGVYCTALTLFLYVGCPHGLRAATPPQGIICPRVTAAAGDQTAPVLGHILQGPVVIN